MKRNIFLSLALSCGALSASAITTTLEYEDTRETNTLAVLRSEIVAATNSIVTVETDPVWTSEKSLYATTNALAGYIPRNGRTEGLGIGSSSTYEYLSGANSYRVQNGTARPLSIFTWPGSGSTSDLARLSELSSAIISATNSLPYVPVWYDDGYDSNKLFRTYNGITLRTFYEDGHSDSKFNTGNIVLRGDRDIHIDASDSPGFWLGASDSTNYFGWGDSKIFYDRKGTYAEIDVPKKSGTLALVSDVSSATNSLAASIDFTPSNPTLVSTIESVSPQPGDYANVSNLAYSAVQSETDPVWTAAAPTVTADIATNAAGIAALEATSTFLYHIYSGSNAVFEVTNYNSQVHAPTARLLSLTNGAEYVCVWTETNGLSRIANASTNYTDAAILAATNRYALRAWSSTTSGLGADAPSETTWISTPTTVIAGGYEYSKYITSSGAAWVLTSNGMTSLGEGSSSAYLDIAASDGTSVLKLEKTDSYLVGVSSDAITVNGSTITISVPVVSADHPYLRYASSLASPVTWHKEEDSALPEGVSVVWSGSSGAWVATVTSTAAQGFFFFEFLQEGSTKITLGGGLDVTNGLYYNGTLYMPSVSGTELKFIAQ